MAESQPIRVLILTHDAGAGHRSAANAVDGALRARYGARVVTATVNPLPEPPAPMAFREAAEDYLNQVPAPPTLSHPQPEATESPLPAPPFRLSAPTLTTLPLTPQTVRCPTAVVA